ncbi:MAG TPA: pyridoxal-dependent decarboxylase [Bryobacteraceae bacterium]|nr:pyridoxal-dependent decarboxylase [Bryobacteraceae bacterium]
MKYADHFESLQIEPIAGPSDETAGANGGSELSLDPVNWRQFREMAHAALDDALDFVQTVRERPVWKALPEHVRANLASAAPITGQSLDQVYEEFCENVLPYATGNIHPRFFGWVHGSGLPSNIIAEILAAAMNVNCGGRDHAAIYVERAVLGWCKEWFQFPAESTGLLVSGTSMANLIALTVARNACLENVRKTGLRRQERELVAYASCEVHESVGKAFEVLGLGACALRKIEVDDAFRINVAALRLQIALDRAAGLYPFCVIGCAGTVNNGAIDDLDGLASICREEDLWFHVDGAFGALCILNEELRDRLTGIERSDSIAFDFHKWAHVQYDCGCVLVRQGDLHRAAFSMRPPYLEDMHRGLAGGIDWPCEFGIELSRGFRALKVWFALKEHGTLKLGQLIKQNCDQAQYLRSLVLNEPRLELMAPAPLNIVCFRFRQEGADPEALDCLNEAIVTELQLSGVAAPSTTRICGHLAIRVNITNHRTRYADLDLLIGAILAIGEAHLGE